MPALLVQDIAEVIIQSCFLRLLFSLNIYVYNQRLYARLRHPLLSYLYILLKISLFTSVKEMLTSFSVRRLSFCLIVREEQERHRRFRRNTLLFH